MAETETRLALLSPHGLDASKVEQVASALAAACRAAEVASVLLRLAPGDERGLINLVKRLAPPAQERGAAVLIACPGFVGDLVSVAARGGADGVHVDKAGEGALRDLRGRLREGRILGAGGVAASRHEAMAAGEAGVDYLMFGGLFPDGAEPDAAGVNEAASWWAEIFETPCIAVATEAGQVGPLARTGAEFIGLESAIWLAEPDAVGAARERVRNAVHER